MRAVKAAKPEPVPEAARTAAVQAPARGQGIGGAFCRALGDVRLSPEEVPADDPLTSVTPTVEKSPL
jgi:hypothetical protein